MSVRLIAEAGCNHMGDLALAKEFIKMAAVFCKADAIKFQKRTPRELLTEEQYNAPHPDPRNAYGPTYGSHREFLEFSIEQHAELQNCCEDFGIEYGCSVWDMTSAKGIAGLRPKMIKIPSACNNFREMLIWLCENYEGEIHVSLGMTTRAEEKALVQLFADEGRAKDAVLYSCTSGYPVPPKDICLLEISRIKAEYGGIVKAIGFSGHHNGIAPDIAALTLGAAVIERHFTLDRTWKGTDHAASLEPDGLRKLKRDLENVEAALRYKEREILDIEEAQRVKLKHVEKREAAHE
ncbi:MAG: N-acetylneuraminate synthase family protein [Defluviitaleaceae bacterium]|nr:N-acetylneuraminate synthase family protein [Defluviitaleaceae bacterium]